MKADGGYQCSLRGYNLTGVNAWECFGHDTTMMSVGHGFGEGAADFPVERISIDPESGGKEIIVHATFGTTVNGGLGYFDIPLLSTISNAKAKRCSCTDSLIL